MCEAAAAAKAGQTRLSGGLAIATCAHAVIKLVGRASGARFLDALSRAPFSLNEPRPYPCQQRDLLHLSTEVEAHVAVPTVVRIFDGQQPKPPCALSN